MSKPIRYALSVRQPWAWLIVQGFKDIENRSWPSTFRGPFYVHAAKGMTHAEYYACKLFVAKIAPSITLPSLAECKAMRGGIVGTAEMLGCLRDSESPWFTGQLMGHLGFHLANAKPLPFHPCLGTLGFYRFDLKEAA